MFKQNLKTIAVVIVIFVVIAGFLVLSQGTLAALKP